MLCDSSLPSRYFLIDEKLECIIPIAVSKYSYEYGHTIAHVVCECLLRLVSNMNNITQI